MSVPCARPVREWAESVIVFEEADLGYGRTTVLQGLNLTLNRGDFLGIVGPNGAGKTTILKCMLGILRPLRGRVHRDPASRFGYVPQRQFIDEVYPLSAMEVAMMGRFSLMGVLSRPSADDRRKVMESLKHVGIEQFARKPYRELSGGQKQRVLIARALAAEPDVLILDEPTNDMDIGSEHAVMELLKQLQTELNITIVMVSHLLNVVANFADTLALIDGGLRQVGRTEDVLTASNLSGVYEVPVQVVSDAGRKAIFTGGNDAQRIS